MTAVQCSAQINNLLIADGIKDFRKYKPGDLRFTQKDNTVYVFSMEKPNGDITAKSLAEQKISSVKLLGSDEKVEWSQNDENVIIKLPKTLPDIQPAVFVVGQ
ncbi:hypothetical protein FACS189419_02960 [Planctomycetales bacterium]|nr:hypothetical protein FACS189419_02960 [Planctomycetales bacterium]